MTRCHRTCAIGLALVVLVAGAAGPRAQAPARVAAAADLTFALEEIAARFGAEHDGRLDLIFGSSGNLTRQILDGAPIELFLSADEAFIDRLAEAGLTRDRGVLYGIGRIAIFAPHGSPLEPDGALDGLRALVADRRVSRFAIANPAHAPYGRAAEAALRSRGLWHDIEPMLVFGENVAQAAQFATSGNAVGGILAYALALAPPLSDRGTHALIPETDHPPLNQRMALLTRAGPTAERFYRYLQGPEARAVLRRYGFALPDDPATR